MKKSKIIFTPRSLPFILEAIGNGIDKDGFIIDAKSSRFTLDPDGKKIKYKNLIGIIGKQFITRMSQIDTSQLSK
jgi:hypothetical protein